MSENSLKTLARNVAPPVLWNAAATLKNAVVRKPPPELFDGDGALFRELAAKSKSYLEYGIGQSTIWVAENTEAQIAGIDSSSEWIDHVASATPDNRCDLKWVDIGDMNIWGRPKDFSRRNDFAQYPKAPWTETAHPDLILIDGRFRVCCFLTTLAHAAPGANIIFDDYTNRPLYHVVEEYLAPTAWSGRQAHFVVPDKVDVDAILAEAKRFELVFE